MAGLYCEDFSSPAITEAAQRFGTPFYLYSETRIHECIEALRAAFGNRFQVSFAVKANPNPFLLTQLRHQIERLDISSGGELVRSIEAGWPPSAMSFTGPAKSDLELRAAIKSGVAQIVVECLEEAESINAIAAELGVDVDVLLRFSPSQLPPGFGVNMAGKPSAFGIDDEEFEVVGRQVMALERVNVTGFHVYAGTQCLDADALAECFEMYGARFAGLANHFDINPRTIIWGAGFGLPYHDGQEALDLGGLADRVNRTMDALREDSRFAQCQHVLELGRYLVGDAGLFVTKIVRVKKSRGQLIALCDGGLHHHLAAAGHFGSLIPRNYPIIRVATDASEAERATFTYDLSGPLCTSIDKLGRRVVLPKLEVGDLLAIGMSGAYGLTASPIRFISHPPPREIWQSTNGLKDISLET